MKRYVTGIVLLVIGGIGFIGAMSEHNSEAGGSALMFLVIGGILFYFGKRAVTQMKRVIEIALPMLKQSNMIDASEIAGKFGMSELKVRELLTQAQRKGTIPFKAEIK